MKDIDCNAVFAMLEEAGDALARAARRLMRTLRRMTWPALLASSLLLALLLTIVPLALTLFVVFVALKLAVGAILIQRRKRRHERQPPSPRDDYLGPQ